MTNAETLAKVLYEAEGEKSVPWEQAHGFVREKYIRMARSVLSGLPTVTQKHCPSCTCPEIGPAPERAAEEQK